MKKKERKKHRLLVPFSFSPLNWTFFALSSTPVLRDKSIVCARVVALRIEKRNAKRERAKSNEEKKTIGLLSTALARSLASFFDLDLLFSPF